MFEVPARLRFRAARRRVEYARGRGALMAPPADAESAPCEVPEDESDTPPEYRFAGETMERMLSLQSEGFRLRDAGDERRHREFLAGVERRHAELIAEFDRLVHAVEAHDANDAARVASLHRLVESVEDTVDETAAEQHKDASATPKEFLEALGKLPMIVQIILVIILYQGSGLLYEKLAGHPPPQVTIPTAVQNAVQVKAPSPEHSP